jgi:hypothetical protein
MLTLGNLRLLGPDRVDNRWKAYSQPSLCLEIAPSDIFLAASESKIIDECA